MGIQTIPLSRVTVNTLRWVRVNSTLEVSSIFPSFQGGLKAQRYKGRWELRAGVLKSYFDSKRVNAAGKLLLLSWI